ncbi:MAG: TRAP transporter substrate-binding protein [Candidatus Accumulibacter sp.]|jgi:tripartite ATP-independent transporter DctP family solute receptor|nr:TRAP transporter substrate-binding protein [Accumulibacter sp.]
MKKTLSLALSLLAIGGLTFAGGVADAAAADKFNITMATPSNPEDNCVKAFFKFKELVEQRSGGRIAVDVKHTGQLGAHRDYIEQIRMGSLEAAEINVAVLSAVDSKFMVFDLPYISKSQKWLEDQLEGGLGKNFADSLEKSAGIKIIGWMVRSPRNMYISTRPVVTAPDFAGMKVRIMESPVMRRTFELLGAVPVPLTANERYMALQTKVVDAAENSTSLIITQKEYEVTKYVSRTEHFISPNIIALDPKFFAKLPADLQDIVVKAGNEAGHYATKLDADSESTAIVELKKLGMTVNDCPDKSTFQQKVNPIYAEYRDKIGGDVIDAFTK